MPTLRLDLAYDGTDYHGFATQPDLPTVQGELDTALTRILGPVTTVVAGRTDAGVHARHQVVSLDLDEEPDLHRLHRSLTRLLPPSIAVWRVMVEPDGFSARFDATVRHYRYRIQTAAVADPERVRTHWHVPEPLDIIGMDRAAAHLRGEHDFASFCRAAEGRSSVRTVLDAGWYRSDATGLEFRVSGTAFCHQQVRSMVGFQVEVGRGRVDADATPAVLAARDRAAARAVAPPHGLVLWEIRYPPKFAEPPDLP